MADRTTNILYETKGANRLAVPIANGITLPIGSLVQSESGFANHHDGTGQFLGIVISGENLAAGLPVGDTSQSPDPAVYVDASGTTLVGVPVASSTVPFVHVYCDDSDVANLTITQPTTDAPIGMIVGWRSATDVDVQLFTPKEHLIGVQGGGAAWV